MSAMSDASGRYIKNSILYTIACVNDSRLSIRQFQITSRITNLLSLTSSTSFFFKNCNHSGSCLTIMFLLTIIMPASECGLGDSRPNRLTSYCSVTKDCMPTVWQTVLIMGHTSDFWTDDSWPLERVQVGATAGEKLTKAHSHKHATILVILVKLLHSLLNSIRISWVTWSNYILTPPCA